MGLFQTQERQGVKENLRVRVLVDVSSTAGFRVQVSLDKLCRLGLTMNVTLLVLEKIVS